MAVGHFRGRTPPRLQVAAAHGVLAASGLLLLLLAVSSAGFAGPMAVALCIVLIAALGGFTLLSFHLRGRALPNLVVVAHGGLAVIGFVVLLAVALGLAH
jgi:hypothetical protein